MSTECPEIEIKEAMDVLMKFGLKRFYFNITLYIEYPTPMKDVNLKVVQKTFGVQVGYSDHTLGIEVPFAAVAMPQLLRNTYIGELLGPDHVASLEPEELKAMVKDTKY
jgi:N-acetylneuraminate synthase/N,N'-diacetyllegionaminate synthase